MLKQSLFVALSALTITSFNANVYSQNSLENPAPIEKPSANENAEFALKQIQGNVNKIQTLSAQVELERERKEKKAKKNKPVDPNKTPGPFAGWEPEGYTVKRGPMTISRNTGAYLVLKRKNSTDEYIANKSTLWSYDHGDKEARYVSTGLPGVSGLISSAFNLDVFSALDQSTLKLIGSQTLDGEPCWVIEGKSPSTLSVVGVQAIKMRIWTSKNDGIPRQIKIPSNDNMIIRIKDIKLNESVDTNKFNWTLPKGVKSKNIFGF